MNKRGFTLIEIIVSIILIVLIGVGSLVGVKIYKNKSNDKFYKQFDNALEIYLSDHSEIYTNLSDNAEGAVVTLEVLKNEGLIKDNIIDPNTETTIDYSNNYYVLSDAVLLENTSPEDENACNGQVELSVIRSWDTLSGKVDTSKVLYVCPKNQKDDNEEKIDKLEERIGTLEYILSISDLGAKNYVLFDVNHDATKTVTWGNDDLWRIVSTNNNIKIMYDEPIKHNFNYSIMNEFKNKLLEKIGSGYDYIKITGGKALYLKDDNVKIFTLGSSSCDYDNSKYFYVYNNVVYEQTKTSSSRSEVEIINPPNDTTKTKSIAGTLWQPLNETLENIIYNKCYISEDDIHAIHEKSDIIYFNNSDLKSGKKFQLSEVFNFNYYSVFNFKTSDNKSIKNMIYNQINDNLKSAIIEHDYQYTYTGTEDGDLYKRSERYRDLLGTISYDEGKKMTDEDATTFIGKKVMFGKDYYSRQYELVSFNGDRIEFDTLQSEWDGRLYSIATSSYYPTITLNRTYRLMLDINEYPATYRQNCGTNILGSKDCPYMMKIGNYYSNGERIS